MSTKIKIFSAIIITIYVIFGYFNILEYRYVNADGYVAPDAERIGATTIPDTDVYQATSLIETIEIFINWILGFLGIIVFSMFLFSGFEYATAGGDENKAKKSIERIQNTVIGMIILFFAFVATNVIVGLSLGRI